MRRSAANAKTASKRGSETEKACERGCSLMPRAPRSTQRRASLTGSSLSSASRTKGISLPSLSSAQASTRSFGTRYPGCLSGSFRANTKEVSMRFSSIDAR